MSHRARFFTDSPKPAAFLGDKFGGSENIAGRALAVMLMDF